MNGCVFLDKANRPSFRWYLAGDTRAPGCEAKPTAFKNFSGHGVFVKLEFKTVGFAL